MPTFDNPDSQTTYTTPSESIVEVYGAGGADSASGQSGGTGGYISIQVPASTELTITVSGAAGNVTPSFFADSPLGNGGSGGFNNGAEGGGGGGSTAVQTNSGYAEAGGGGGAGGTNGTEYVGGGGGAGGGTGGSGPDENGDDAQVSTGLSVGGDGGDANPTDGALPGEDGDAINDGVGTTNQIQKGGGNDGAGEVVVTPKATKPTGLTQSVVGDDEIDVVWDAQDAADSYDVQVSVDGGGYQQLANASSSTYTYTAAPSANTHRFRVRAINSAGQSDWAYTDTVATDPSGLSATAGGATAIDLDWSGVRDATEYAVLRAESPGPMASDYTTAATPNAPPYTNAGLTPGTQYHYRIQAVYTGTDSQLTAGATATADLPAPTLDSLDAATADEITISYAVPTVVQNNAPDATVQIFRSTDGSLGDAVTTISDLSQTSYTDTGLADGTQYHYTIRLVAADATADSGQQAATTILPPPTGLATTAIGSTTVDIEWSASHDAGATRIEYKPSDTSTWTVSETVARTVELATIDDLRNGEEYDIRVIADTSDAEEVDQ